MGESWLGRAARAWESRGANARAGCGCGFGLGKDEGMGRLGRVWGQHGEGATVVQGRESKKAGVGSVLAGGGFVETYTRGGFSLTQPARRVFSPV